jgi:hypothetical protein
MLKVGGLRLIAGVEVMLVADLRRSSTAAYHMFCCIERRVRQLYEEDFRWRMI